MISSMVLFFKRDCAVGAGPVVDAPNALPPVVAPAVAPAVAVAVEAAGPEVAVDAGAIPDEVVAAVVDGCVVAAESAGLPNNPPVDVAGWVVDVDVAVVPGVDVAVDLGPPNSPSPDGAAALEDGVAEDVVPPREGKGDCCVVLVAVVDAVVDAVDGWGAVVEPNEGNTGFDAVSALGDGALKSDGV